MFRVPAFGHVAAMPGRVYEIRYPNGDFEFDAFTQQPPPGVGETLRRRGKFWTVTARTEGTTVILRVEPAEERVDRKGRR
jgi:hypothetical protein